MCFARGCLEAFVASKIESFASGPLSDLLLKRREHILTRTSAMISPRMRWQEDSLCHLTKIPVAVVVQVSHCLPVFSNLCNLCSNTPGLS